jgi:ligand-binding sensor domain-containing protein
MLKPFLLILFLPFFVCAQSELFIGQWVTHLPYNNGLQITQSKDYIYYATAFSLLQIDKSDFSSRKITRTEGLSGSQINCIYFHPETKTLIVAYSDGLLDLVKEDGVSAVPDIKIYNNVPINKTIRSITHGDAQHVFINADYGISYLNLITGAIAYTAFTPNLKINFTIQFKDALYSATAKGLYKFDLKKNLLVQDFGSWQLLGVSEGLNPTIEYTSLAIWENKLYTANSIGLFVTDDVQFIPSYSSQGYSPQLVKAGTKHLILNLKCNANCNTKIAYYQESTGWQEYTGECASMNLGMEQEENGRIWYADNRWGFRYMNDFNSSCEAIYISGPFNEDYQKIFSGSDGIYIASGSIVNRFEYRFKTTGIYTYKDKKWDVINGSNLPLFNEKDIRDIVDVAETADGSKIYFASYHRGILQYDRTKNEYTLFDQTNSALGVAEGDETRVRVSSIAISPKDKSLWACDFLATKPLVSLSKDGNWQAYDLPGFSTEIIGVTVDRNGYKWIIPRRESGVMVFDEGDPANPGDDRSIILNTSNSSLTSNLINTIEVDLDGDVWVGTNQGPVIFECGASIFEGNCKGSRRKVDQDGIIGYLLETEDILSIAIDGANRKWIGTRNGLYVQSSAGDEQVYIFNTENSPLMSNAIFDIAINQKNGDVWIGTERGIQVYRSEATFAKDVFTTDILVYPNPVHADYTGPVAISGLARDARVKITDLTGRLVFETLANGGTAIWYGKDYLGKPVSSGTYLVFANSTQDFETSEGAVSKIVITR